MKTIINIAILCMLTPMLASAAIDRQAVVSRNNPVITKADTLASLSVGNGHFATTVDVTGLQSYPLDYKNGVPLCAMSDWGWHQYPNSKNLKPSESEKSFDFGHGHKEIYAVEYKKKEDGRHKEATEFLRVNPHRLNLGAIGLYLTDEKGKQISLYQLTDIRQEQKLFDGEILSSFVANRKKVEVTTGAHPSKDALYARIKSELLADKRATLRLRFPYPTGKHADDASDWTKPERHKSEIISQTDNHTIIKRTLDATTYYVLLQWEGKADIKKLASHDFELSSPDNTLAIAVE